MKKDESLIPPGSYCYTYTEDGEYVVCPYWSKILNAPEQADGYCAFLEKGDIEIGKSAELVDMATGEVTPWEELPFNSSLLWDQVKECGINDEIDENDYN